jgi:hypothetical protein
MNFGKTVVGFALATLTLGAQEKPQSINYNSSKSNTGNIIISPSNGGCTAIVVSSDSTGTITSSTTSTAPPPCTIPNGEYVFPSFPSGQIPQVTLNIPQIADGGVWSTTLVLTNTTSSVASVSITFYQETGKTDNSTTPWTPAFVEGTNTQNISLAGGATMFLHTPGTATNVTQGWGQAVVSDGVQIYALFSTKATGQGTAPATVSGTDILIPFDNTFGNVTAIALANPTPNAETITMVSQIGTGTVSQSSIPLAAYGHAAFLLPSMLAGTVGAHGLVEFTNGGGFSAIGLQSNPTNFITTAQAYSVNGPIIGAVDTFACVKNPQLSTCPNPPLWLVAVNASIVSGGVSYPLSINVTPGANGYNATVNGAVGATQVNGSFVGGNLNTAGGQLVYSFVTTGQQSTFNAGSLNFTVVETGFDAVAGVAVGTANGQITLNQAGVGIGTVSGNATLNANTAKTN